MIILCYYVIALWIQVYLATAQFPNHVDLQHIDEVLYNNGKYNLLKPTVHKTTDYFEQFMRRTETRKNEKILIDNNGVRHFWTDVGMKPKKFKKSDVRLHEINKRFKAKPNEERDDIYEEVINLPILRKANKAAGNDKKKPPGKKEQKPVTKGKDKKNNHKTTTKVTPSKTKHTKPSTTHKLKKTSKTHHTPKTTTPKKKHQRSPKSPATSPKGAKSNAPGKTKRPVTPKTKPSTTPKPKVANKQVVTKSPKPDNPKATTNEERDDKEENKKEDDEEGKMTAPRTAAITTYFCPFLGIINVTTFID